MTEPCGEEGNVGTSGAWWFWQVSPTTFWFVVEFLTLDGERFVQEPCCGVSEGEMPPQTQFDYTVVWVEDQLVVPELPVYVP
jgi:hypothetical protein